ncbi:hypothetical protein V865_002273 [Kwoniella europaea PYCC6329]|uniref:Uncharacterized protein n=1 Tax=Kwoniella europaea PYCC6329 TaxID=1423913 RepID=A0AAX4KCK2_9TREE
MGQWSCQLTLTFASSSKTKTGRGMTPKSGEPLEFCQVRLSDDTCKDQSEPSSKKIKRNDDLLYQRFKAEHSPPQQARVPYVCFEEHRDRIFLDVEPINSSQCLDQDDEP